MIDSLDAQQARLNEHDGYAIKACYADRAQKLVVAVVSAVLCLCCRTDVRSEC